MIKLSRSKYKKKETGINNTVERRHKLELLKVKLI